MTGNHVASSPMGASFHAPSLFHAPSIVSVSDHDDFYDCEDDDDEDDVDLENGY